MLSVAVTDPMSRQGGVVTVTCVCILYCNDLVRHVHILGTCLSPLSLSDIMALMCSLIS